VDWIAEYLEWSNAGESIAGSSVAAASRIEPGDGAGEAFIASYLEWMESAAEASEAALELARREAALWAAMRAESDCVRILRRMLETAGTTPRALYSAFDEMEHVAADVHALVDKVLELRVH
jgi:hypothetical protein